MIGERGRQLAISVAIWVIALAAAALLSVDDIETSTQPTEQSE